MCSITTEPVSARTCPKHRPRRTGPSGPKNITTPLHHIGKRGPMCKHLKGRSRLCRRYRLGREKRNRAAGLLTRSNGGSGCTSDCEVNRICRAHVCTPVPHAPLVYRLLL